MKMLSGTVLKKDDTVSAKDMSVLAIEIVEYFHRKEYNILNSILKDFDFKSANKTIIVGMVRYTYCGRQHLPEWNKFLSRAKAELDSRNVKHSLHTITP